MSASVAEDNEDSQNTGTAKQDCNKVCGVCSDKAFGYNFNAVTCESCKAFFRRNALKNKEFRCPFNEHCDITPVTRRFCQKCRLQKCFDIGMRKDWIMSEEDKQLKKIKIEQNRARRQDGKREAEDTKNMPARKVSRLMSDNTSTPDVYASDVESPGNSLSSGCSSGNSPASSTNNSDTNRAIVNGNITNTSPVAVSVITLPTPRLEAADGALPVSAQPTASATLPSMLRSILTPGEGNHGNAGNVAALGKMPLLSSLINPPKETITIDLGEPNSPHNEVEPMLVEAEIDLSIKAEPLSPPGLPPLPTAFLSSPSPKSIDQCSFDGPSASTLQTSTVINNPVISTRHTDTQSVSSAVDSIESILSEAIKLEFEAYSARSTSSTSRQLNEAERAKLNELIVANKALLAPLDDDLSTLIGDDCHFKTGAGHSPMLLDVINLTAIAIRRLIKMAKRVSAFKNMCQEDQVALLKGGCTEMMILRSAMTYDPDNATWKIPHSQERLNVKVDVLKEARGNIYQEHQRFLQTFNAAWRTDESIMLLLGAITLFTPDRPHVVHQDVIKLEQNSYYYLLRRYLESKYAGCEARSVFLKLIQKMAELHKLNEDHVRVYLDVNPRDVEPLLIEIFDLKPH
ncbi:hypothetical protein B566_EDAN008479 [Ephemera danica]|nr:hypothetical protein B566_EDAN008479 [Ephemera danica]